MCVYVYSLLSLVCLFNLKYSCNQYTHSGWHTQLPLLLLDLGWESHLVSEGLSSLWWTMPRTSCMLVLTKICIIYMCLHCNLSKFITIFNSDTRYAYCFESMTIYVIIKFHMIYLIKQTIKKEYYKTHQS